MATTLTKKINIITYFKNLTVRLYVFYICNTCKISCQIMFFSCLCMLYGIWLITYIELSVSLRLKVIKLEKWFIVS